MGHSVQAGFDSGLSYVPYTAFTFFFVLFTQCFFKYMKFIQVRWNSKPLSIYVNVQNDSRTFKLYKFLGGKCSNIFFLISLLQTDDVSKQLIYHARSNFFVFSFVFWKNWRHQKVLLKLTDLLHRYENLSNRFLHIRSKCHWGLNSQRHTALPRPRPPFLF